MFTNSSNMPFSNMFRRKSIVSINEPENMPTKEGSIIRRLSRRSSKAETTRTTETTARRSYNGQNLVPPSFPQASQPTAAMGAPGDMQLDAPPTYSEAVAIPTPQSASTADDPFAFLSTFDTVFLIDDSGSMAGRSWNETAQALAAIAPICAAHDADGIDVWFMNTKHHPSHCNLKSSNEISEVFTTTRPWGPTPTGTALNNILRPYLRDCEHKGPDRVKPLNIIVITDGVPTDDPESVIIQAAKRLEKIDASPYQVGIQFFQVGREPDATEALKDLDDGLVERGCARDIVDTVPWKQSLSADSVLKVVLGAVNRRLDRKRISSDSRRS